MDNVESTSYMLFNFSGDNSSTESLSSSSDCSSIGNNSDDGKSSEDGGDEVESPYKGSLDMMQSLEEVLPVRKGISKYYNGKSKSFTNLAEEASSTLLTSSSSMKDLAKPENPYSRRRRNLLCHQIWENNNNKTTPRGGISKKQSIGSSRSALTLAMAVAYGEGSSSGGDSSSSPGSSPTNSGGSPVRQRCKKKMMMMLPPLYPRSQGSFGNLTSSQSSSSGFCAWKSYSVADFPSCYPAMASDS